MKLVENFSKRKKGLRHIPKETLIVFGLPDSIEKYLQENSPNNNTTVYKISKLSDRVNGRSIGKVIVLPDCPEAVKMRSIGYQDVTFIQKS